MSRVTPCKDVALNERVSPPGPIPREARRYLAEKKFRPSDHWAEVWREEHATAFTIARMARGDLAAEMHRELVKALESGETMETFRKRAVEWTERRGWRPPAAGGSVPYRLARIYRTNMRTARAAGQWARIQRTVEQLPYLIYSLGPSAVHRDEHVAWAGIILPVSDPWWNTHFPPNGWGCRCRVRQVTERERRRLLALDDSKYKTAPPATREVEWRNPATGQQERVSEGIDPGWDYNPGAHRTLGVHRRLLDRAEQMVEGRGGILPGLDRSAREEQVGEEIERYLEGPGFEWFLTRPRPRGAPRRDTPWRDAVPIGVLPVDVRAMMQASTGVARMTDAVAAKQRYVHHSTPGSARHVPIEWYRDLPKMLRRSPWRQPDGRWVFDWTEEGRRAVLDVDVEGQPLLVTLHPLKDKKAPAS